MNIAAAHRCEAAVLHCIDFRFQEPLHEFLEHKISSGYDLVVVAGGVKCSFIEGEPHNFLFEQFEISSRLHNPKRIILIQHEDCGAYGGSSAFENAQAEQQFQRDQLHRAKLMFEQSFPQKIETYFIRLSGEVIPVE